MSPHSRSMIDPNQRAEALAWAQRGTNGLGRWLFFAALIELVASVVRVIADPSPTPVVLCDLAAVSRAVTAALCGVAALRLTPYAATFGLGGHAQVVTGLFFTTAIVPIMRFFDIVPQNLSEAVWDAILIGVYGASFVIATLAAGWLARQLATASKRLVAARRFATALSPVLVLLPLVAFAVAPELSPHPAVPASLALIAPWLLTLGDAGRRLRPDQAAGLSLGLGTALGLAVFLGTPLMTASVALVATALVAAFGLASALHLLHDELTGRDAVGPSATFLRRLVAGDLGGEGSRVGNLPESSHISSDESDAEESLALAYRELGIDPTSAPKDGPANPAPLAGSTTTAPQPLPALADLPPGVVPFIPKSRQQSRPEGEVEPRGGPGPARAVLTEVPRPATHDWTTARKGIHRFFQATVALTVYTAFTSLLALTPLVNEALALTAHAALLLLIALFMLSGATRLSALPDSMSKTPVVALQLALFATLGATLTLALAPQLDLDIPAALMTALGFCASYGALLLLIHRLGAELTEPRLATRARSALALTAALALTTTLRFVVQTLEASDLQWLAWPLGLILVALFLALAIGLLWLLKDTETAMDRQRR